MAAGTLTNNHHQGVRLRCTWPGRQCRLIENLFFQISITHCGLGHLHGIDMTQFMHIVIDGELLSHAKGKKAGPEQSYAQQYSFLPFLKGSFSVRAVFKEEVATSETCHQPARHDENHLTIDRAQELGGLMSLGAPQRGKGKLIDHVSQKLGMKNIRSADKNQKWNTDRQRLSGQRQRIEKQRSQQRVAHLFSI